MHFRSTWSRLILYALLITAIFLRFWALDSQSLWLDELWSIETAAGHDADHRLLPVNQILDRPPDLTSLASAAPVWRTWTNMSRLPSPSAYFLLLRIWMTFFGQSEASLRSLSAIFSVLALIVFFPAVRSSIAGESALWAAAIFAIATSQIHYAQDARPYAMLLFEAAAALLVVFKIYATGPTSRKSVVLIIAMLCLLLTHYFAIAVLFAIGVYALFCTTGRVRKNILTCVILAGVAFTLLWGPAMWQQIPMFATTDRASAFLRESGPNHLRNTLWRLMTIPMSLLCDIRPIPHWYAIGGLWYLLGAYLLWQRKVNPLWPLLYIAVIGQLALLDLLRSTAHLAYIRYSLIASLPAYAILAALLSHHRIVGRIICSTAILFCVIYLPRAYSPDNEDFRSFGRMIGESTRKGDLIVFAGPAQTYAPQILYLAACHYAAPLPGSVLLIQSPATPELMAQLKSHKTLWVAADPAVPPMRFWLPGYHTIAGKDWPEVGTFLEMQRDE